ncbi:hypothetical protein ASPZODRAFT_138785 [Penicilliopsis zonata CBS 506.65]|uniref:FAD-binding domain-containing protein n=1 Tax=Penicilliopsis zonata CBS 506.65 TaxID=1073090 RepID=A0A1L9SWZ4_9EURO|nr:hypothetical protein ASPZODRAFT_138785 [Penicilliopsis zonata CBS 506.65]OJJ51715.1 hypothetical protein ASPZODRAFT_138785 [Penicilliopsis zonata CBS 506.65]
MSSDEIAIIGAGLCGLALALSLHQKSIPCTIYEARPASLNIGGAIMLSPNALRILDTLGVYSRIADKGYHFDLLYFRSPDDKPLDTYEFGNKERYGYHGLRIYRHVLIDELLAMCAERQIPIHYNRKFIRVVRETASEVTWEFDDGSEQTGRLLVGADGIHSRVRRYLYPDLEPTFTNAIGVTAAVPMSHLTVPDGYKMPVTIINPTHGAFVIAPQQPDASEVLIGRQKRLVDQASRAEWANLMNNKDWCIEFLRDGAADFPPIVQTAVADIPRDHINLWPFYVVPALPHWMSVEHHCRVVVLGDAAHAIPPTAGQGINQGFEDVYTFAAVLDRTARSDKKALPRTLLLWQSARQARIDRVLDLNRQIDARRLPESEGGDPAADQAPFDQQWLFEPDFDQMVDEWFTQL